MTDPVVLTEIDAILQPIKAAIPGISNGEIVHHLPERLRGPFWERAVDRYLAAELAKLDAASPKPVTTVAPILDGEEPR
jgi:hypothetical protein